MLVEAIMLSRMLHEAANLAETLIHGDSIHHLAVAVGHRAVHAQHQHIMGMMMEEVSNKIHIEPSITSQFQIRTHES